MNIDIDKIINIVYNDNKVSFALLFNHQLYMTNQNRFLRSKRLRAALWYATDGKCQICGCDLPDRWHADHIERWAETQRTNVHEMQALCPQCHINKTIEENRIMNNNDQGTQLSLFPSEPLKLRKHQEEFFQICNLIKAGEPIQRIIMLVTPGGGKSVIPVIAAAKLIPSKTSGASFYGTIADSICWIVPRLNLQEQAEFNFMDSYFQQMLNHSHKIRANNNDPNPPKGTSGYAATYQAIAANPSLHAQEIQRRRYILVLDEFHHVEQEQQENQEKLPLKYGGKPDSHLERFSKVFLACTDSKAINVLKIKQVLNLGQSKSYLWMKRWLDLGWLESLNNQRNGYYKITQEGQYVVNKWLKNQSSTKKDKADQELWLIIPRHHPEKASQKLIQQIETEKLKEIYKLIGESLDL